MVFCKSYFVLMVFASYSISMSLCESFIERMLTNRYNDISMKCVDQDENEYPAYACSGLLIRGVHDIPEYLRYPWMFKQRNKEKQSFSMAFLRRDTPFSALPNDYDSGFIIFPHLKTPRIKKTYQVFCAFPMDGYTDGRDGIHACGKQSDDYYGISRDCQSQQISSIAKWAIHYSQIKTRKDFTRWQCGFDMTRSTAPRDFGVFIQAIAYSRKKFDFINNELLIETWNEEDPKSIPIEAFFFLLNVPDALSKARMYQDDYLKLTGEEIPIVGILMPKQFHQNIVIEYVPRVDDQTKYVSKPLDQTKYIPEGGYQVKGCSCFNEVDSFINEFEKDVEVFQKHIQLWKSRKEENDFSPILANEN